MGSTQPVTLKGNADIYAKKLRKVSCKIFNRKADITS